MQERETNVVEREGEVSDQEMRNSLETSRLAALQSQLRDQERRLTSQSEQQSEKSKELQNTEKQLAEREKKEDDEDADEAFALNLVRSQLDRIQETSYRQQLGDASWPPEEYGLPDGPGPKSDAPPSLTAQLQNLEARYKQVEKSVPQRPEDSAGREAALSELASACADLISRGSIESIALQAPIDVDLELMRDLAQAGGSPSK